MFKKKSKLPARPKAPTFEEIQEDISQADDDDVAFTTPTSMNGSGEMSLGSPVDSKTSFDSGSNSEIDELESDPDILFNRVKTFVEVNKSLQSSSYSINDGYEVLVQNGQALQADAERVKKRIADALRWQGADTCAVAEAATSQQK